MKSIKDIINTSLLLAISVVVAYVESFIPLPIPGVRLGFANVIILLVIYEEGFTKSIIILLLRILIMGFIKGSFLTPIWYMSLSGGLLSFIIMFLFSKVKILHTIVVSVLGSLAHVTGQIIVAYFFVSSHGVFYYLPIIAITALGTGILSGFICSLLRKRYQQIRL